MNLLIKSATILNPLNKALHLKKRDILVSNGKISKIAAKIQLPSNTKELKAKNLHISLGWFDTSVSFGEPGYEERETIANGLLTAAKSGFTGLVLNPNTHPIPATSSNIVFLKNASQGQLTALYPLGTLTAKGDGVDLAELYDMKKSGAVGFYDYKRPIANANLLKIALQYTKNFEGVVYSYPLNEQIAGKGIVNEGPVSTQLGLKGIPTFAEDLRIARDLFILEYTGGKLHIPTISTAGSVKLIAAAKNKGLNVSCSVAIHQLLYTDDMLTTFDANYKVQPPLRSAKDSKALIKGLKDGTIDGVTSDHTPIAIEEKNLEFDNAAYGTLGLESAFGALNGLLGTEKAVALLVKGRSLYGIEEPSFEIGTKANLTLFNPDAEFTSTPEHIWSTSKNSLYFGSSLKGKVIATIHNNMIIN